MEHQDHADGYDSLALRMNDNTVVLQVGFFKRIKMDVFFSRFQDVFNCFNLAMRVSISDFLDP